MTARAPSRQRPLSSAALSASGTPDEQVLRRKYSLDHGDSWRLPPTLHTKSETMQGDTTEVTQSKMEDPSVETILLANGNTAEEDENHNGPLRKEMEKDSPKHPQCNRKVLKKQTSLESIGFGDSYFYDFFDRNIQSRPSTPAQIQLNSEDTLYPSNPSTSFTNNEESENKENNNTETLEKPCRIEQTPGCSGASSKVRRNVNNVRPRSWLTSTSTEKVEDCRRVRRRQTDPCGKDFLSNYERALSSLLYQPYDCRSDNPSVSSSLNYDDSDVGYWLGNGKRWGRERERRSDGDCCSFQNEDLGSSSSSSSLSSSSDSLGEFMRRKPWGDSKDPSSSSIRALLGPGKSGNSARSSDPDPSLAVRPLGALATTGYSATRAQSTQRHGDVMLVNGVEPERDRGSQSDLLVATASGSGNSANGNGNCGSEDGVSVCYRAVPATVSAVPSIPCNNVSNVRIVQTTRTFTSTEAQTDDVIVDQIRVPPSANPSREQRRRERRERRHQRRLANHLHPHQTPDPTLWHNPLTNEPSMVDRLPDILNSHLPPPYSTLPMGLPPPPPGVHPPPPMPPPLPPPIAVTTVPGSPPPQGGLRFPFAIVPAGRRRSRLSPHFTPEDEPKSCCGVAVSQTLSIRWFIILIFLVGLCCAVVGTVLGAMKATGREHLTVSLLMIGVGIVLVAVSGVAWRLTSQEAPSCRAMLGLGGDDSTGEPNRRFVPRLPPSYGRPHHPYAAMMYPEFQYRAPPPSYQASMQEYRLRLLLLDRHSGTVPGSTVSPPPTYRSQPGSLLRAPIGLRGRETHTPSQSEYSRPPSYRSRTSSRPDPSHSREPSGSDPGQAVNVITVHPHIIKLAPSPPLPSKGGKDSNLVTIVQTASQPTGPVIVTISGQEDGTSSHCHQSEMEILAHL